MTEHPKPSERLEELFGSEPGLNDGWRRWQAVKAWADERFPQPEAPPEPFACSFCGRGADAGLFLLSSQLRGGIADPTICKSCARVVARVLATSDAYAEERSEVLASAPLEVPAPDWIPTGDEVVRWKGRDYRARFTFTDRGRIFVKLNAVEDGVALSELERVELDTTDNPGDRMEGQRLLDEAAPCWCAECGPHVKIDEDGCCATCGRDTFRGRNEWLESERIRLVDELAKYRQKASIYGEKACKWRDRCIKGGLAEQNEIIEATEYQGYEKRIAELELERVALHGNLGDAQRERDELDEELQQLDDVIRECGGQPEPGVDVFIRALSAERDQLQERLRLWEATREDGRICAEQIAELFCVANRITPQRKLIGEAGDRYLASLPKPTPLTPEGGQPAIEVRASPAMAPDEFAIVDQATGRGVSAKIPAAGEPVVPVEQAPDAHLHTWPERDDMVERVAKAIHRADGFGSDEQYLEVNGEPRKAWTGDERRPDVLSESTRDDYRAMAEAAIATIRMEDNPPSPAVPDVKRALEILGQLRARNSPGATWTSVDHWMLLGAISHLGGDAVPTGGKP